MMTQSTTMAEGQHKTKTENVKSENMSQIMEKPISRTIKTIDQGSLQKRIQKVDHHFEKKKITKGGVTKSLQAVILMLEQNPPERKFLTYIKIFSQEDFALKSKL